MTCGSVIFSLDTADVQKKSTYGIHTKRDFKKPVTTPSASRAV